MPAKPAQPLARSVERDVLDWPDLDPVSGRGPVDVLGLREEDRMALGMRTVDAHESEPRLGDAHAALLETLALQGAHGKSAKRR